MSYIFKVVWQSNQTNHNNIQNLLQNHSSKLGVYDSPFDLSVIPEKESIKFLKCFGFHINKISEFISPVENRDHCAHASGFIQYSREKIHILATEEINHITLIQNKLTPLHSKLFVEFFTKNFKPEDSGSLFPSGLESADLFIRQNILSLKDLEMITSTNFPFLTLGSDNLTVVYQKVFFLLVCARYDELMSLSYHNFLVHLPKLLNGFDKQDQVSIEDLLQNEFYEISREVDQDKLETLLEQCPLIKL